MDTSKISHLSLCFGYGGIDLGLQNIFGERLRTAAICEIEAFAIENALAKMEAGALSPAPIWTDLRTFPWGQFTGTIDILSGGFPCQPFSTGGSRNYDEDQRHLFPFILEGIRICRPGLVFLENVEGILQSNLAGDSWRDPAGTPVLLHVCRELERIGYQPEWGIFSAEESGYPQPRKRIFILAKRDKGGIEKIDPIPLPCGREAFFQYKVIEEHKERDGDKCPQDFEAVPEQELADSNRGGCREAGAIYEPGQVESVETSGPPAQKRLLAPSQPGCPQQDWEPPRVIRVFGESENKPFGWIGADGEPPMVRNIDGTSRWMDYAELCKSYDSRHDEMRLLANGVVPATAKTAFLVLAEKLKTT